MRVPGIVAVALFVTLGCRVGAADTTSYTGTLANSEDMAVISITLTSSGDVTLQTFGFGGGVNGAGMTIGAGGFDPFVGLFSGTGDSAVLVNGTSDILTNYTSGCPPAGTVTIGSVAGQCGDVNMQFTGLAAGTYSVVLTDGDYIPEAIFEDPGGMLGDGFVDFSGGAFQTCDDADDCNNDTADWALDITTSAETAPPAVPEPPSVELAGMGAVMFAAWMYRRERKALG